LALLGGGGHGGPRWFYAGRDTPTHIPSLSYTGPAANAQHLPKARASLKSRARQGLSATRAPGAGCWHAVGNVYY